MIFRSLLYNVCFTVWTGFLAIFCIPALLLHEAAMNVGRLWAGGTLFLARILCGITYEIRGKENLLSQPAIYACKHQSAWETVAFWILLSNPGFVLKKELTQIPLFGLYLISQRHIVVDRSGGGEAMKQMLADAKTALMAGKSIVIFPEGTRIKSGEKGEYHPGVAMLYNHLEAPLIPVALNSGRYWGRNAFVKKPGRVVIEFMPPMEPGMRSREFLKVLEEKIETASNKL